MDFSIKEIEPAEFACVVDYFLNASDDFLAGMGVDRNKFWPREKWLDLMDKEYKKDIEQKELYFLIWQVNNRSIGHSNINKIVFGKEAYTHMHIWHPEYRKKGVGESLVKLCLGRYFELFKLETIFCEPYALNPGPNRVLELLGFEFIKQYETIPGWTAFHQPVNRWAMSREKYYSLNG
ncbi:MAG TPA: GNAT family N-acetyltransferase [Chitinophagaceae bacterium]|nr:GNAT family N-acetyltransferase [Chitinophagaceae bacterium]